MQPELLGCLRALVGGDAEDVASDTWLEIARDLGGSVVTEQDFGAGPSRSRGTGRWITCGG